MPGLKRTPNLPPQAPPLHRVTMVGPGGVGKSALALQYVYNEFVEEYDPTKADSYRKEIEDFDGDHIIVDILDTAGQEEYSRIKHNYLRSGKGYLLVFSICERESFQSAKESYSEIIRVVGGDTDMPLVLVGNKSDLAPIREVGHGEAEAFARSLNCEYIETSAKTRNNVEECYHLILPKIIHREKEQERLAAAMKQERARKGCFGGRLRECGRGGSGDGGKCLIM